MRYDDDDPISSFSSSSYLHLYQMVQLRSVYQPMCFIAFYNIFQIPNAVSAQGLRMATRTPTGERHSQGIT